MYRFSYFIIGTLMFAIVSGCSNKPNAKAGKGDQAEQKNSPDEHAHAPSAHGGIIVPIGRDNYHAEAVFEKGGTLRLYILGQDESKVQEIESQPLPAFIRADGDTEAMSFELKPTPQPGDKPSMSSLFIGIIPKELIGKKLDVTIPNIVIKNERFRIAFQSANKVSADDHGMPVKVDNEAEKKLYLTAAGKYTDADIKANGSVTASEKFKSMKAQHDLKPKPGDKVCPITLTKANPKFSWVIGGKTYEFCCPPCVDEFVALAKEKPSEVLDPEEYRKK